MTRRRVDYRDVFRGAPDAQLLIAPDPPLFTALDANDAFLRLTGRRREEVVGNPVFETFPEVGDGVSVQEADKVRRSLERVVETGRTNSVGTLRYDLRGEGPAPGERYWTIRNEPIFGRNGELASLLHRVEDVTDLILRHEYGDAGELGQYRVLVVEPDAEQRDFMVGVLGPHWEVEVVADAGEAWAAIERQVPDAVVMAGQLPDSSGLAFVEQVKAEWNSELAVLVRFEQLDPESHRRAFEAGADDVIVGRYNGREYVSQTQAQIARTELRQLLEEQVEQAYRRLFMQAPSGIALLEGPDHVYTLSNPAHDGIVGGRSIIGKPVREALPELEGQDLFTHLDRVFATGEPYYAREQPFWVYDADKDEEELRYCTFAHLPYFGLDGAILGVAAFVYDVTELVCARKRAEELADQAQMESERKDEFLAMLGHELRNPLAPVVHAAELLSEADDPETVGWAREVIARQANQLTRLVDDLLDVSRINQGRIAMEPARCRLAEVIEGAVEESRLKIEKKRQQLSVAVSPEPRFVTADRDRMIQVVSNLLDNASKYTPEEGHIWLESSPAGEMLRLEVRDDGAGIEPAALTEVFELFRRADASESGGGLGVGLALVRQIVELHGGTVQGYSDGPGQGCRFVVELPIEGAGGADEPSSRSGLHAGRTGGARVLAVEDNRDVAAALERLLRRLGNECRVVHSAADALAEVTAFAPDLIILDIGLPDSDGYELARRLRQMPAGRDAKLAALTGFGGASSVERARRAGIDTFLVKPAGLEELRTLLEGVGE